MFSHSFNADVSAREVKMSKPGKSMAREEDLSEVRVDVVEHKQRRNSHSAVLPTDSGVKGVAKVSTRSSDFVYVNNAYVGSLDNVNQGRIQGPPTDVYREQYWTCSKWSLAKKLLAIWAAVVTGAAIGLSVTMGIQGKNPEEVIGGIFRSSAPD